MNITAREQFGESQYLSKYSNQLVELMQPVALNANKELYSEEYQALATEAQAMYESGEFNSLAEAQGYVNDAFQMYLNPYNAVSSGNTMQKWTAVNTIQSGGTDSPSAWLRNLRKNTETAYSWAGGDSLTGTMIETKLGGRSYRNINVNKADETDSLIEEYQTKSTDELERIYDNQVSNADDFATTSKRWDTWFKNATTWIGDIKNAMGQDAWGIASTIVKGIGVYLGGKFLLKLAGSALGKAVSGTASAVGGTAAATGGSTALGLVGMVAGGITLGVGAANVIKMGIESAFEHEDEKNVSSEASALEGTALEGNKAAEIIGGMATTDQKENNNFGSKFGSAWNTTTRWIGVGTLGWTRDTAQINKDDLSFFREKVRMLGGGPTKQGAKDALLAWTLLLASADRLGDIDEFSGMTKADLKAMVDNSGVSPSSWDKYIEESIKDIGYLPNKNESEDQTYVDWNKLGIEYHRYGLDNVPYDNYIASLHEGEAVLTSSTANELRNLLTEYRANNQSAINLDVAIQNQTVELVNKLEEVVVAIRTSTSSGGIISTSTLDQTNAIQKLQYSMTHLVSTKSALN